MNKIGHKFLLIGDKLMPELHLRQPGFTYSAWRPFTKHLKKIQEFRETDHLNQIYENELDKACFTYYAAYSGSKESAKRTVSNQIMKDRPCEIAKSSKYDGYKIALAIMFYIIFLTRKQDREQSSMKS